MFENKFWRGVKERVYGVPTREDFLAAERIDLNEYDNYLKEIMTMTTNLSDTMQNLCTLHVDLFERIDELYPVGTPGRSQVFAVKDLLDIFTNNFERGSYLVGQISRDIEDARSRNTMINDSLKETEKLFTLDQHYNKKMQKMGSSVNKMSSKSGLFVMKLETNPNSAIQGQLNRAKERQFRNERKHGEVQYELKKAQNFIQSEMHMVLGGKMKTSDSLIAKICEMYSIFFGGKMHVSADHLSKASSDLLNLNKSNNTSKSNMFSGKFGDRSPNSEGGGEKKGWKSRLSGIFSGKKRSNSPDVDDNKNNYSSMSASPKSGNNNAKFGYAGTNMESGNSAPSFKRGYEQQNDAMTNRYGNSNKNNAARVDGNPFPSESSSNNGSKEIPGNGGWNPSQPPPPPPPYPVKAPKNDFKKSTKPARNKSPQQNNNDGSFYNNNNGNIQNQFSSNMNSSMDSSPFSNNANNMSSTNNSMQVSQSSPFSNNLQKNRNFSNDNPFQSHVVDFGNDNESNSQNPMATKYHASPPKTFAYSAPEMQNEGPTPNTVISLIIDTPRNHSRFIQNLNRREQDRFSKQNQNQNNNYQNPSKDSSFDNSNNQNNSKSYQTGAMNFGEFDDDDWVNQGNTNANNNANMNNKSNSMRTVPNAQPFQPSARKNSNNVPNPPQGRNSPASQNSPVSSNAFRAPEEEKNTNLGWIRGNFPQFPNASGANSSSNDNSENQDDKAVASNNNKSSKKKDANLGNDKKPNKTRNSVTFGGFTDMFPEASEEKQNDNGNSEKQSNNKWTTFGGTAEADLFGDSKTNPNTKSNRQNSKEFEEFGGTGNAMAASSKPVKKKKKKPQGDMWGGF